MRKLNDVYLKGIIKNIEYSHKIEDNIFYKASLLVPKEGGEDLLQIKFKQFSNQYKENSMVSLYGNLRSYNSQENGKNKTHLYVFTYLDPLREDIPVNSVHLDGRICKMGELRKTHDGKDIIHFTVANNIITPNGKNKINSYIPCTAFGKLSKQISKLHESDFVELKGDFHSREYRKKLENGEIEIRVAYEVIVEDLIVK